MASGKFKPQPLNDKKLNALMAKAMEGIVLYDVEGIIIYASQSIKNFTGYDNEEILGEFGTYFVHEDDIEEATNNFFIVSKTSKKSITFQQRLRHKNGTYIWSESTLSNFLHDPNVGGIISNFRDITEQKKAETELLQSKALLENINYNIKEGIYRQQPHRNFVYANKSFLEMFRFESLEELNSVPPESLYADKDVRNLIRKELTENQHINNYEAEFVRSDGTTFWGLLSSTPMYDQEGTMYLDGAIRDITEQKIAEERLKRSEDLLISVNRNIKEGLYRSSYDKGVIYVNDAFAELFGYKNAKEIYRINPVNIYSLIVDRKSILEELEREGIVRNREIKLKKCSGEMFWALLSSYLVVTPSGEKLIDGSIRDVTELKEAQKKLIELNKTLKQKNRALKSREKELNTALKQLSERNFELDQFVYKTSHDLRSPLSSILGLINVAKIDNAAKDKTIYFDKIEDSIHRLDEFVRSMLNHAQTARIEPVIEEVSLLSVVNGCIRDLQFIEHFNLVNINIDMNEDIVVKTDKLKLRIVIGNIISNVFKYRDTSKKASFLKISAKQTKSKTRIQIEDNGIGIEKEHLPKIFDMFYRATERSQGSGLGMYIVKQSVDKLKGDIKIESAFGQGTKFIIDLY